MKFVNVVLTVFFVAALGAGIMRIRHRPAVNPSLAAAHFATSPDVLAIKDEKSRQKIVEGLEKVFGTPVDPHFPADLELKLPNIKEGAEFYREKCLHCHGLTGDGAGPTAKWVNPPPRDFRRGAFKFTSTDASSQKPADDDLLRILHNGATHTAMPSFVLDPEEKLKAVIEFVKFLSFRGEVEGLLVKNVEDDELADDSMAGNMKIVDKRWVEANGPDKKTKPPAASMPSGDKLAASIENGNKLFHSDKAKCSTCHGDEGRGDGSAAINPKTGQGILIDVWKNTIYPANLTLGVYRGGQRPIDLFYRVANGIKGTPMPGFRSSFTDEEVWDIVNYVRQIPYAGGKPEGGH